jgi:hypothetical protein
MLLRFRNAAPRNLDTGSTASLPLSYTFSSPAPSFMKSYSVTDHALPVQGSTRYHAYYSNPLPYSMSLVMRFLFATMPEAAPIVLLAVETASTPVVVHMDTKIAPDAVMDSKYLPESPKLEHAASSSQHCVMTAHGGSKHSSVTAI